MQKPVMQRRIGLAEVFAETSHAKEDSFSGESRLQAKPELDHLSPESKIIVMKTLIG